MFVSSSVEECVKLKVYNERIEYGWLPIEKVQEEMKSADVLFLPLSFKDAAMEEVKTVYATKTLDYLISGTPILVFSPSDSFHSISAKRDGWGLVVDEDSSEAIYKGIIKLTEDRDVSDRIVNAAFVEAERRNADHFASIVMNTVESI